MRARGTAHASTDASLTDEHACSLSERLQKPEALAQAPVEERRIADRRSAAGALNCSAKRSPETDCPEAMALRVIGPTLPADLDRPAPVALLRLTVSKDLE